MCVANAKTLRDLEFERLKTIVQQFASSSLGEEAVDALQPIADREEIERRIAEVNESIRFITQHPDFTLGAVRDLAPIVQRAQETGFLDGEDFQTILQTIEGTQQLRDRLAQPDTYPHLAGYAERLAAGGSGIATRIRRTIDERGEVRDDATPELMALARKRRASENRLESKLRSLMDRNPDLINDPVITRRRGRLVVPIRSGATGAMDFVVHDRSATGQTLYAEPTALVGENNAIAELTEQIRAEVRRILRELTDAFVAASPALLRDRAILSHIDSLMARAGYAHAHHCAFPRLGETIALRTAKHPLLPRETAVPITLSVGDGTRMAIITGPNTGGKTVSLKTLGLLTLMVQSGIPGPMSADSDLPVVARVRTDIGDEQSIEQNLSTFSAHMKNIVGVLEEADEDALILLDELGAGTDPQEGAALGLSVIEALLESNALTVISTHLTPLKYFAVRHPEVKTASMEFDLATLSPTFRVVEGVPGRSNAFVIAERLGLSKDRIDRARSFLSQGEIRAEDIIEELHRERQALSKHREDARRERVVLSRNRKEYEQKLAAFEDEREEALSDRLKELETSLREGQQRLEKILAESKTAGETPMRPDQVREDLKAIAAMREEVREERVQAAKPQGGDVLDPAALQVGATVHVRSVDAEGRIVQLGDRGRVTVDLDGIRLTTEVADLSPASGKARRKPAAERRTGRAPRPRTSQVPLQLNVRGLTVGDALREVEAYLDQLLLADIRHASILHGKGTGALMDAVRAYLGSCAFVVSFGFAPPNLGGEGVTVIELAGGSKGN